MAHPDFLLKDIFLTANSAISPPHAVRLQSRLESSAGEQQQNCSYIQRQTTGRKGLEHRSRHADGEGRRGSCMLDMIEAHHAKKTDTSLRNSSCSRFQPLYLQMLNKIAISAMNKAAEERIVTCCAAAQQLECECIIEQSREFQSETPKPDRLAPTV